jgi:SAM-dependent methyltransferase
MSGDPPTIDLSVPARWSSLDIFPRYELYRVLIRPATRGAVRQMFDRYLPPGPVLELGSGIGELYRLLTPTWRERLHQTDGVAGFVSRNRETHPGAIVTEANIYDLQAAGIQPGSHDAVVSLCAFDTLEHLRIAARQVARVLRSGGTFMHIMDLAPDRETIIGQLQPGLIPFPLVERGVIVGFQLMDLGAFDDAKNWLDPREVGVLNLFVRQPGVALRMVEQDPGIARMVSDMVAELPPHLRPDPVYMVSVFEQRLAIALAGAGLSVAAPVVTHEVVTVPQTEEYTRRSPDARRWVGDAGVLKDYTAGSGIQDGHVEIHSFIRVLRATMP